LYFSVILAEEKVGRREWRWQPGGRWERWPSTPYSRFAFLSNTGRRESGEEGVEVAT
jgi:hypothetical protein